MRATSLHDRNREAIEALRTLAQTGRYELPMWLHSKIHKTATMWPEDEPWLEYWRAICTPQITRLVTRRYVDDLQRSPRLKSVRIDIGDDKSASVHWLPLHARHLRYDVAHRSDHAQRLRAAAVTTPILSVEMTEEEMEVLVGEWERWLAALVMRVVAHPGWPVQAGPIIHSLEDLLHEQLYTPWSVARLALNGGGNLWMHAHLWCREAADQVIRAVAAYSVDEAICTGLYAAALHELIRRFVAFDLDLPADAHHNLWIRQRADQMRSKREAKKLEMLDGVAIYHGFQV